MSLGTGALMVGREPERLRHSKGVSMATLRAGTTPPCSRQLAPPRHTEGNSVENIQLTPYLPTYKPKQGREGVEARIREDQLKIPARDATYVTR